MALRSGFAGTLTKRPGSCCVFRNMVVSVKRKGPAKTGAGRDHGDE